MRKRVLSSVSKADRYFLIVMALLFLVLSYINLNIGFMEKLDDDVEVAQSPYPYLALIIGIIAYAFFQKKRYGQYLYWTVWGVFVLFYLASSPFSVYNVFSAFVLTLWFFCYRFGIRLADINKDTSAYFVKALLFIVIIPLTIYCSYVFLSTDLNEKQDATDAFFMIIAYLPFILMLEKPRLLKTIMYIVFLILAALSLKRSIILGFVVCSVFYALFSGTKKLFSKWYFWLLVVSVVVLWNYFHDLIYDTLLYRFSRLEEDGGAGRIGIYTQIWDSYKGSGLFQRVFGHGYQAVRLVTSGSRLAHNDLLELLYDFGIMGVVAYVLFLLSFVKIIIKKYKMFKNTTVYSAFVGSFVFFIILSAFNCVIYSPMIISPFMLSFGIMIGSMEKN